MNKLAIKLSKDPAPMHEQEQEQEQEADTGSPQPTTHVTEPEAPPDDEETGYTTLFYTLFLSLLDEFEQHIYRSVNETTNRSLADDEMLKHQAKSSEDRLLFVMENLSPEWQQGWFGNVLRPDILAFLRLKSSLQSGPLSLPELLQVSRLLSTLLSGQGSLSQILGADVTGRWRAQLDSASAWVNTLSRVHSLPRDSIHSLLHGLFSNNLLPEWMNDLVVQAGNVYRRLGQIDELEEQLQPALKTWQQATTPLDKVTAFLDLLTDDALVQRIIPHLQEDYPDIASLLGNGLLIKQTFLSNNSEGDTQEHLATALGNLLDPEFSSRLRKRAGSHPPLPWLLDTLTQASRTLQAETLSMGALRTSIRLSDPTLSWEKFILDSMNDVSVMQMAKTSLQASISLILHFTPGLSGLQQTLQFLKNSTLWQACLRSNVQDLPLAIVRGLHDDLSSKHSQLLPLLSDYLKDNMQKLLAGLNLLMHLLEAGAAGQSKSVMLALIIKSGRIGGTPDILTLIAEKTLHFSLLWRLWSARNDAETAGVRIEIKNVLAVLPDEYIVDIGAAMQWLPLLRDVYHIMGELPALNEGERPAGWLLRLNQQLITIDTPAAKAIHSRLALLLPDQMMLSSALLRSINTSMSSLTSSDDLNALPPQRSLRQWLWDTLSSLSLSRRTVLYILRRLKNVLLTPRMAVALVIGYSIWAAPTAQAAGEDGSRILAGSEQADIPNPLQMMEQHQWAQSVPSGREDVVLRERQAIELMAGEEGENYWQHLTWSSGLMALLFMSAAIGVHMRKRMQRIDGPYEDAETGRMPDEDVDGERQEQSPSAQIPLIAEHAREDTDRHVTPGLLSQFRKWSRENPLESVMWALGAGMLPATAFSGYRWHQTRQKNEELLDTIDPVDLIITVTPALLTSLQQKEVENPAPEGLPRVGTPDRLLPPRRNTKPTMEPNKENVSSSLRSKRDTHENKVINKEVTSPHLRALVKMLWGDSHLKISSKKIKYHMFDNFYEDPESHKLYIKMNNGPWEVTRTSDRRKMLLHNDIKPSTIPGAGNGISTIPIHRTEGFGVGDGVWTTTLAITLDLNAIRNLFSWEAYTPEFTAILNNYLLYTLSQHTTIEMSKVITETDASLEKLFFENHTNIKLSKQILQARMELDLKIRDHESWPSPNNEDLLKQIYIKTNPSQIDYYVRAMSFEISDRALFNEAFELSITQGIDHISENEKSINEDIELQKLIIKKSREKIIINDEEIKKINNEIKNTDRMSNIGNIIEEGNIGNMVNIFNVAKMINVDNKTNTGNSELTLGSSIKNHHKVKLQQYNKNISELNNYNNDLKRKINSAEKLLPLLNNELINYQRKIKKTKKQLQTYIKGIEEAHLLISQKAPELLNDNGIFNAKKVNNIRFDLILRELEIYDISREEYSEEDIDNLHKIEAQKQFLLLIVNQQKITEQHYSLIENINNNNWNNSYLDVLLAIKDAKKIINNNNYKEDENHRTYLLAATIYRMRKEKHPLDVVRKYSAWQTINIFEKDRAEKNTFIAELNESEDFKSFTDLKPNNKFEREFDYNQQFKDYREKFMPYESKSINLILYISLGNKISADDIFSRPKKAWVFDIEKKIGNFITIELQSGNWVFISSMNGQFIIKYYTKKDISRIPALKILTNPNTEFGYQLIDGFGPSIKMLRTYPYYQKTFEAGSEVYDPDCYRQFLMSFYGNGYISPKFIFQGDSAAFDIDGNLFSVTKKFLNKSLDGISRQLQKSMDHHSALQLAAMFTIPFYDVIYKSVTNSEYTLTVDDIGSIIFDALMVLVILATAGIAITSEIAAQLSVKTAAFHALGYSGRALVYKILMQIPGTVMKRSIASTIVNTMIDIIAPIPLRGIPSIMRAGILLFTKPERLIKSTESINKLVNLKRSINHKWQVDVNANQLTEISNNERFNGILVEKNSIPDTSLQKNNYIRHENATYLVKWDEYARTWRVIDPKNGEKLSYQTAVKFTGNEWVTHRPSYQSEPEVARMINVDEEIAGPSRLEPDRPVEDNTGKFIDKFVPIVKNKINKTMVESNQSYKFKDFYKNKEYKVSNGLDPKYEGMKDTYFPEVMPIIKQGINFSEGVTKKALKRLLSAKQDSKIMGNLQTYFAGALGTKNEKIISEAVNRITLIAEESRKITKYNKNKNYKNISISSSIRSPISGSDKFSDTFTKDMLLRKTVAFVHPGDEHNIFSINGDMISVGIRDYADRGKYVGYTMLHETSHLAVATSDVKYFPTSMKNTDNAEGIKNYIEAAINNKNINTTELDKFTRQVSQVNRVFGMLDDDEIYHALKTDAMLRSNFMLSNADSVASYLIDIADERTFNTALPRLLEPEISPVIPVVPKQEKVLPPPVNISRKRGPRSMQNQEPSFNFNLLFLSLIIEQATSAI